MSTTHLFEAVRKMSLDELGEKSGFNLRIPSVETAASAESQAFLLQELAKLAPKHLSAADIAEVVSSLHAKMTARPMVVEAPRSNIFAPSRTAISYEELCHKISSEFFGRGLLGVLVGWRRGNMLSVEELNPLIGGSLRGHDVLSSHEGHSLVFLVDTDLRIGEVVANRIVNKLASADVEAVSGLFISFSAGANRVASFEAAYKQAAQGIPTLAQGSILYRSL